MSIYATEADEAIYESDEGFAEGDESTDESAWDEARRRINTRVPTARPTTYRPPMSSGSGPVTAAVVDAKIEAARAGLNRLIEQNSQAIRRVDGKVAELSREQGRHRKAVDTKIQGLQKDLQSTREMAALVPLLTAPSSRTLTSAAGGLNAGDKVFVDSGDKMNTLLPFLLLGGMGGSSGSSSSGGGAFGDNSLMTLVLLMTLTK